MENENNEVKEEIVESGEIALSSDNNEIKIADDVVAVIAGVAVSEVPGVAEMAGGFAGGITEVLSGKKNLAKGIKVEKSENSAKIDVNIIVEYGSRIPDVAFEIQSRIKKSVKEMTGLDVVAVNVHVQGVQTPQEKISKVEETIIDDHFLKQYELIRFAYVIEEAGQIQRPYYNIAIIRHKNEYTNFYLFVMKSKTNQVKMFKEILQSFNPTNYTKAIFEAIISFDNHEYERSRKAWEEVLQYDELSVIANTGLGNAYYYDLQFEEAARYFAIAKNRSMY